MHDSRAQPTPRLLCRRNRAGTVLPIILELLASPLSALGFGLFGDLAVMGSSFLYQCACMGALVKVRNPGGPKRGIMVNKGAIMEKLGP